MGSDSFQKLAALLREEPASGAAIYPPRANIFHALNLCPFDQDKVVIVGQDPRSNIFGSQTRESSALVAECFP
jgi:uracil DNA glycosylase